MEQRTIQSIENPDQSPLATGGGEQSAILRERKSGDSGVVSHDELGPFGAIVLDPDLTFLEPRADEDDGTRDVRDLAEALRVSNGLNLVEELEVGEVVDEDLLDEDDDDPVAAEADALDLGAEGEFADAAGLVVVPDHDLVDGVLGVGAAADKGEDVAAEEHLDEADPTAGGAEIAPEDLAERVAVVDAEAGVGANGEAAVVLVEGEVEEGGDSGRDPDRVGVGVLGLVEGGGGHGVRGGGGGGVGDGGFGLRFR